MTARTIDRRAHPAARRTLGAVEAVVAVSGGRRQRLRPGRRRGGAPQPAGGIPFHSSLAPSLVLLVVVAGSASLALAALAGRHRRAPALAIAAGAILVAWIAVEVVYIPFSWLQPAYLLAGVAMIALGRRPLPAQSSSK